MRIANRFGVAMVALGVVLLPGAPARAETAGVTIAASADSDGTVRSFGQSREGAVRRNTTVAKDTLGYVAERDYC
ncbi:hypothetical protein ODJ79_01315 [Actinoplanes sp. KI2]|uniref:hypothetical protein n=1 Tax=Actinoplanes sp. KI2 TaxID=2983315 RepID=UPI0021D5BC79|nr:hypothetical protein [Actinoplanes sp. KI2]MCU7722344.1 hypothetical protein [Actinoplanes sp. KI2]